MTDDTTSMVGFPLTYDADAGGPAYTAQSYQMTAGAAHAIPDGSPFGGVQGVRAGSPSPLVSMDGTTATVSPHMGWLCPWSGSGAYEYAIIRPVQVSVESSTGSYKIAVVLADQAAGHGSGEQVSVQSYSGSVDDRMIDGLVIATVSAGIASDTAPVISQTATVSVSSLDRLQAVSAAEGMQGMLADGSRYVRRGGAWAPVVTQPTALISSQQGTVTGIRAGDTVQLTIAWRSASGGSWGSGSFGILPVGWRPLMDVTAPYQGRDGASQRQISIKSNGTASYQNMGGAGQNTGGWTVTVCYLAG